MTKEAPKEERRAGKFNTKIIYVYSTADNKNYVKSLSAQLNITESDIINKLIDAYKNNKRARLKRQVPSFVIKAEKWMRERQERLGRNQRDQRESI